MSNVQHHVDEELLKEIRATLKCAAQDIEAYLDSEYPPDLRAKYPTYARRHARDFKVVTDAHYCVDMLKELLPS